MVQKTTKKFKQKQAILISTVMGLGHMRAAYPLKDLSHDEIDSLGSPKDLTKQEYKIWQRMTRLYYFLSKSEHIPIIGKYIFHIMISSEEILSYYPKRDLSAPNWAVKYLNYLIKERKLCLSIVEKINHYKLPVINTYFASAIAIDKSPYKIKNNFLMICDTDINRVWVPDNPGQSKIKYFVPCEPAQKRLLAYGVKEENILFTGFPLPKENLGTKNLEILKQDLFNRLLRLDPQGIFFDIYKDQVKSLLKKRSIPQQSSNQFTVLFAIGGAGAQYDMAKRILFTLKEKIKQKKIQLILALGVQKYNYKDLLKYIDALKLNSLINNGLKILYNENIFEYFVQFNQALRETDVLWTKPSELSFYAGLCLPILIAPPIGSHEELNKKWLLDMHSGIEPEAEIKYCDEWLFDLRDSGRFAEAAWHGFLKAPKYGTFNIEEVIQAARM